MTSSQLRDDAEYDAKAEATRIIDRAIARHLTPIGPSRFTYKIFTTDGDWNEDAVEAVRMSELVRLNRPYMEERNKWPDLVEDLVEVSA